MQLPSWQVPTEQGVPLSLALHLPFLHFFPCLVFSQLPFLHFWHSPHRGLHLPPAAASIGEARPRRPSTPLRVASARRREPADARVRVRISNRLCSTRSSSSVAGEELG